MSLLIERFIVGADCKQRHRGGERDQIGTKMGV